MASSLDEAREYDFFQEEMEKLLSRYQTMHDCSPLHEHMLHVFIEFASFNRFVKNRDDLNTMLLDEFSEWLKGYNPQLPAQTTIQVATNFVSYVKSSQQPIL